MKLMLPKSMKNPLKGTDGRTKPYDPRIHGVRQSHISCWLTCREMARLAIVQGWQSVFTRMPLVYGSLSHGILKYVYRLMRAGETPAGAMDISIVGALGASEVELDKEMKYASSGYKDLKEEAAAILLQVMPRYFNHWWKEDTAVKWDMVEDKFNVPIDMPDGTKVPLIGTYDATFIKTVKKKPQRWLFETKNKARWSERIGSLLPLDLQLGIYLTSMSLRHLEDPVGVRYNLIRRPGERRKVSESFNDFATRIGENVSKDPGHYFERIEMELTKDEKEEHLARTHALVRAFYAWWKDVDHTNRDLLWNSGACENKYGECSYLDICSNGDHGAYKRTDATDAASIDS